MLHRALFPFIAGFAWCVACTQSKDDACGKGNVYDDGVCRVAPVTSAGTGSGTAGSGTAGSSSEPDGMGGEGGSAGQAPTRAGVPFGDACAETTDCGGDTDYCVPMSPFDTAYCSASGCDAAPELCPEGWTCTDLSRFVAGAPWACTRRFD